MIDLRNAKAVLLIFAMPGCGACEDYLPRLQRQVADFQRYGHAFHYVGGESGSLAPGTIPILIIDATSADEGVQALADQHGITGMPTTLFFTRRNRLPVKHEGGLEDREIYDLLVKAAQANR